MRYGLLGTFIAVVFATSSAHATLIGDSVDIALDACCGGWTVVTPNPTVGAGVETTFFYNDSPGFFDFELDIGASVFNIDNIGGNRMGFGAGELLRIEDLDWTDAPGEIVGVILDFSTITNFDMSDITFGADWVHIDLDGTSWEADGAAQISLITRHVSVPEPGTLGLVGAGLIGLLLRRRRVA